MELLWWNTTLSLFINYGYSKYNLIQTMTIFLEAYNETSHIHSTRRRYDSIDNLDVAIICEVSPSSVQDHFHTDILPDPFFLCHNHSSRVSIIFEVSPSFVHDRFHTVILQDPFFLCHNHYSRKGSILFNFTNRNLVH